MGAFRKWFVALGLALFILPCSALAQSSYAVYEKGLERASTARKVSPLSLDTVFGDQISLFNGSVSFTHVDVSIPGNSDIPVELRRTLTVDDRLRGSTRHLGGFLDWDLDIPYLQAVVTTAYGWRPTTNAASVNQRCSLPGAPPMFGGVDADDYWDGYTMHIPGQGNLSLLMSPSASIPSPTDGNTYPWTSKEHWRLRCKSGTKNSYGGESFIAVSPSGLTYHFDWGVSRPYTALTNPYSNMPIQRQVVFFLATRIEDRFGNWVELAYSGDKLTGITSNDGRYVTPNWAGAQIASVASSAGTWNYAYAGSGLSTVTQPDASTWQFTPTGSMQINPPVWSPMWEDPTGCPEALEPPFGSYALTVKAPSGALAHYAFDVLQHIRSSIPETACVIVSPTQWYWKTPTSFWSFTLQSKAVSGPGVPNLTTNYSYGGPDPMLDDDKENGVLDSDGTFTQHTFGTGWAINEGQSLKVEAGTTSGFLNTVENEYVTSASGYPFPDYAGYNPHIWSEPVASAMLRPLKQRTVTQQGATFTWKANAYNAFAKPTNIQRYSSGTTSDRSRTDVTNYYNNTLYWVIGETTSLTNSDTGIVLQQTDYNAQALPWKQYRNGKLESTTLYHGDGTPSSISDGNGNTISLNSWKRGIPQGIGLPATAEAPSGSTLAFTVNDAGWVTQKTDENGFSEDYQHDAMGRTSRVDYPTGDLTAWAPTLISFQQINSSEYGIPAGHWKRTQTTGNRTDITYYDGLWRPLVSETFDAANPTATRSITVKRYDAQGRTNFESRPVASISAYTDSLGGTTSQHDAIDRLTQSTESSELGNLTTTVEYLNGLQTKITNPRNAITQTALTAWDEPTDSMPVSILLPEGRVTDLSRDAVGDVTVIKRRDAANTQSLERKFVRDAHRRICKQIDPESGSTVRDFDNANNVVWQASGLNLPSTTSCDSASAYSSGRRIDVTWDARNRETQRNFPDGRGNTATTYYPDNLVHGKTTYNDPGSGAPVVSTQTYDKRRFLRSDESTQPGWYTWGSNLNYDTIGNVSSRSYPNGLVVSFNPNALGHPTLVQASDGQTLASNISMYPNGALQSFTYGNGIVHTMLQNARQLPSRSTDVGVIDFTFGYDATRNPTEILDQLRGSNFSRWMQYDLAERLTDAGSCSFGGDCWHRNTYDVFDNIKSWKLPSVRDYADYQYSARNLPEQIKDSASTTVVSQSFDPQGNLSNKNGQAYSFDFGNRLREVVGKQWSRYDGHGHRVLRWEASEPGLLSLYSLDNQLLYDDNNRASSRTSHLFVYLQGSLLATKERNLDTSNERWTFQHTDALGSPVAITDTSGTVIERSDWEPWGNAIGKPNMDTVGFTGHQMDGSTQLIQMQQRYYDPNTAQFLSIDPVNVDINSGANFNRRWYANNNPYKFTDPDGRDGANFYSGRYQMSQPSPENTRSALGFIVDFMPIIGDIKGIYDAFQVPTASNIIAATVGIIPIVGDVAGKGIKNADHLLEAAGKLERKRLGVRHGRVQGDVDEIFAAITKGGKVGADGRVTMPDGTKIGTHRSRDSGVPTIDINKNGRIYKIRVDPPPPPPKVKK